MPYTERVAYFTGTHTDVLQEYLDHQLGFYVPTGACACGGYQALLLIREGPGDEATHGTIHSRAQCVAISFQCHDVIILLFDWTFLVLGYTAKYLDLVDQTIFRVQYGLGTRLHVTLKSRNEATHSLIHAFD